jgi:hypothetical protein
VVFLFAIIFEVTGEVDIEVEIKAVRKKGICFFRSDCGPWMR